MTSRTKRRAAQREEAAADETVAGAIDALAQPESDASAAPSAETEGEVAAEAAGEPEGPKTDSTAEPAAIKPPKEGSKIALIVGLLQRPEGTTLDEMMAATGWQKHTVRGALAGALKTKHHHEIDTTKDESGRRYFIRSNSLRSE